MAEVDGLRDVADDGHQLVVELGVESVGLRLELPPREDRGGLLLRDGGQGHLEVAHLGAAADLNDLVTVAFHVAVVLIVAVGNDVLGRRIDRIKGEAGLDGAEVDALLLEGEADALLRAATEVSALPAHFLASLSLVGAFIRRGRAVRVGNFVPGSLFLNWAHKLET